MLEWNVYVSNFNSKRIETDNIFEHSGFLDDCKKAARKYSKDREAFLEEVRKSLMYYFWSKCEWEIVITDWPTTGKCETKIDVFDQVRLNWPIFCDYIWAHAVDLRRREKKRE